MYWHCSGIKKTIRFLSSDTENLSTKPQKLWKHERFYSKSGLVHLKKNVRIFG